MKKITLILILIVVGVLTMPTKAEDYWKLIFEDEFEQSADGFPDETKWRYSQRYDHINWCMYVKKHPETVKVKDGNLIVRAIKNPDTTSDPVPYITGAIESRGKFSFLYGKVDVRAKFKTGQGAWPAIWMMPETATYGGWPKSGEIDIMERVNYETKVHQTVHSNFINNLGIRNPNPTQTTTFNVDDYNNYGVEWYPDRIDFFVNGVKTLTYPRIVTDKEGQWPFDQKFYLILNQAGGGSWTGPINDATLPFEMYVDYVRVYQRNENTPHTVPEWSSNKGYAQDDVRWKDTFVKKITSTGLINPINYETDKRPDSYYFEFPDTLEVYKYTNFSLNLEAFSLGDYTEQTVLQDLRYTAVYFFADFNNDKIFEEIAPRIIGNTPPKHSVGGNMDVMNVTANFRSPILENNSIRRIRVIYDNAWKQNRFSADLPVNEGMVYDFIVKIVEKQTGCDKITANSPIVFRQGDIIQIKNLPENSKIRIFDFTGRQINTTIAKGSEISIKIPNQFLIINIENNDGLLYNLKLN